MKQRIFQGEIYSRNDEEDYYEDWARDEYDVIFIGDEYRPIADMFQSDIKYNFASIRYWISDTPKNKSELLENTIRCISGDVDADYGSEYTEYTGYLWTDEEIMVGGHDLIKELRENIGKFLYMEVDIYDKKPTF